MLRYILLGHLDSSPATGYEIKQSLESSAANFWHAHHSQIYTTLRKLEEEGLITSYVESNNDYLARRIYSLALAGKNELQAWLDEPLRNLPKLKDDLLVRIIHSGDRNIPDILAELRTQRKLRAQQLAACAGQQNGDAVNGKSGSENNTKLHDCLETATYRFRTRYGQMYVDWLDELIADLERIA